MTDGKGFCFAVNLYNLSPGKGVIIGDAVAIPEPFFERIRVRNESKSIEFSLVREFFTHNFLIFLV